MAKPALVKFNSVIPHMIDIETARKSKELIVVRARITFKATTEGGRSTPIKSGYRPNHSFEKLINNKNTSFYIGEIQFKGKEFIYPGETSIVTVIFLKAGGIENYLFTGSQWYIYEVPHLVAEGEILNIDGPTNTEAGKIKTF